jgi:hypothetical protein
MTLLGEVYQSDDDPVLKGFVAELQAGIIAHGHFDSDRRARYTIFTWDGRWQVERRYIDYDYSRERKALMESDMPGKEAQADFFD